MRSTILADGHEQRPLLLLILHRMGFTEPYSRQYAGELLPHLSTLAQHAAHDMKHIPVLNSSTIPSSLLYMELSVGKPS